ncbi:MAG: hypothetical protein R3325_13980 [Thermoanaerobaculia bacterium]|nr:hypothetical protein [Thermoanaerobaculia bacterium]
MSRGLARAAPAAAILGLASAVGDWIWARFLPDGALVPAVAHGILIFALLAAVLGWASGVRRARPRLLATLPLLGLLLAALFYPLAGVAGYLGALLVTWLAMWLGVAVLLEWARGGGAGRVRPLLRGLLAAGGSGLAFWAVSGMWTDPGFAGSYPLRFLLWSFAFLPGFAVLLAARDPRA